ncbi:hypothetical protein HF1_14120 [Mycoplasma haemofelis str. Langford 1]|uniref:Uncharacterized protein n=1 Tax=Mycoplasma haemofelis (strain Langford 1) TaxID=941640 RepID=E8ZJU9_MYCHL|nr:hypothetical protein [Mycoplasma haemofelis]CBY93420.1 hypothetical protein HF1_14120 [Mycoplasma haemofelis str. Langford 1]
MELIQKGLVATLVAGGVGAVGYHTIQKGNGTTLLDHITSKKRELISEDTVWQEKDKAYKGASKEEIISSVEPRDRTRTKLWQILKNWCTSTGNKVFTNIHDETYQKFSVWCLKTKTIEQDLQDEGLQKVTNWGDKATEFKDKDKNLDSGFITPKPSTTPKKPPEKAEVQGNDIKEWCEQKEKESFKHEMDQTYLRVKKWCFQPKEQPKATKPASGSAVTNGSN